MKFIVDEMKFESSVKEKDHQTVNCSYWEYAWFESSVKEKDHQTRIVETGHGTSLRAV